MPNATFEAYLPTQRAVGAHPALGGVFQVARELAQQVAFAGLIGSGCHRQAGLLAGSIAGAPIREIGCQAVDRRLGPVCVEV